MGRRPNPIRELERFRTEANGFVIKYYGQIEGSETVKFIAKISRYGPLEFKVAELEGINFPLLIMESIEWTYDYKQGRNESNNRIDRYSKRSLPELGRDSTSLDNILRRRMDYKRNPGQYKQDDPNGDLG